MVNNLRKTLLSPLFLVALSILLANDFFLKDYFHNFLTGKLSDFTGLFVFALFWTTLLPRWKPVLYSLIIIFFTFWKSPFSNELIGWWNSGELFSISRTIDYTDLIAFVVLPAAWIYGEKCEAVQLPKFTQNYALTAIALVSVFAFTATSKAKPEYRYLEYKEIYAIEKTPVEVLKKLQEYETDYFSESRGQARNVTAVGVTLREKFCDDKPNAGFEIGDQNGKAVIKLTSISYNCETVNLENQQKLQKIFEAEVIGFLKK